MFSKKYLVKRSHDAEKPKKRPFRLIKRLLQTDNFEKNQRVPFDRIQKNWGKSRIVPKKT